MRPVLWLSLLCLFGLGRVLGDSIDGGSIAWDLVESYLKVDKSKLAPAQLEMLMKAKNGDANALNIIGKALWSDKRSVFGDPDPSLATQFFYAAAEEGNVEAIFNLGRAFALGKGSLRPSPIDALHWFKIAASARDASSAYNAGLLLAQGFQAQVPTEAAIPPDLRVKPDLIAALEYFKLAIELSQHHRL